MPLCSICSAPHHAGTLRVKQNDKIKISRLCNNCFNSCEEALEFMGMRECWDDKSKQQVWVCDLSRAFIDNYIEEMQEEDRISGELYMPDCMANKIYDLKHLLSK